MLLHPSIFPRSTNKLKVTGKRIGCPIRSIVFGRKFWSRDKDIFIISCSLKSYTVKFICFIIPRAIDNTTFDI